MTFIYRLASCIGLLLGLLLFANPLVYSQEKELRLINTVPKHLPLKIEIINGDSDDVLRDVRIKVTNSGNRPVYYLKFYISTPEDFRSPRGSQYTFPLKYGRNELITFSEKATPDDVPIKPYESYTFRVDEGQSIGFTETLRRDSRAEPETYQLEFIHLSFGDGTGFVGPKGDPFPSKKREASATMPK